MNFCEALDSELHDFTFPKETVNSKKLSMHFLRATLTFQL